MRFIFLLLLFQSVSAFGQEYSESIQKSRNEYLAESSKRFPEAHQDFFDISPVYKVKASFRKKKNKKVYEFNTSAGKIKFFTLYAQMSFEVNGKNQTLNAYRSYPINPAFLKHIFVPFNDETNKTTSYGAGRYLDLSIDDFNKDGTLFIDFNKCYNPYCAFSDEYNCPIPPSENRLTEAIEAGEKKPIK